MVYDPNVTTHPLATAPDKLPRDKHSTSEVNQALPQQRQARRKFTSSLIPTLPQLHHYTTLPQLISILLYQTSSTHTNLEIQLFKHRFSSSAYAPPIRSRHTLHPRRIPPARCWTCDHEHAFRIGIPSSRWNTVLEILKGGWSEDMLSGACYELRLRPMMRISL
jgi:hypothetical protein